MFIGGASHADQTDVEASKPHDWDEHQHSHHQQDEPGPGSRKSDTHTHTLREGRRELAGAHTTANLRDTKEYLATG